MAQVDNPTRQVTIHSREDTTYSSQVIDARATEIIRGPEGDRGEPGPQGIPGSGGGGGATFAYHQSVPASVWPITHNLGRYAVPVLLLDDDPERPVVTDYDTPSQNQTIVTLPAPATGWAYF